VPLIFVVLSQPVASQDTTKGKRQDAWNETQFGTAKEALARRTYDDDWQGYHPFDMDFDAQSTDRADEDASHGWLSSFILGSVGVYAVLFYICFVGAATVFLCCQPQEKQLDSENMSVGKELPSEAMSARLIMV